MEIITWILEGALEHKDSLGTGSVIRPGEVQRMSAGSGIRHSEFNPSPTEAVHLLQIWILPDRAGYAPSYEQTRFEDAELADRLRLVASPDGQDGSVTIHQNARVYAARLQGWRSDAHAGLRRRTWCRLRAARSRSTARNSRSATAPQSNRKPFCDSRVTAARELLLFDLP